jgi:hypothetical protein
VSIPKPYYRIWRPFTDDNFFANDYVLDHRNAPDAIDLIRGYHLLERELFGLFDFVEPADANSPCYSHQLYALLLRASTEFEANAKAILFANGYTRSGNFNVNDYSKVEPATRLSEYLITIPIWQGSHRVVQPFASWNTGPSLSWYQSYNRVKHSRSEEFASASLQNVVAAVAAVFAIVFAQFGISSFDPYHDVGGFQSDGNVLSHSACLLSIEPPGTWATAEKYDFDWETLKTTPSPYQGYSF